VTTIAKRGTQWEVRERWGGRSKVHEVGNAAQLHVGPIWDIHDENPTWVPQDTHGQNNMGPIRDSQTGPTSHTRWAPSGSHMFVLAG